MEVWVMGKTVQQKHLMDEENKDLTEMQCNSKRYGTVKGTFLFAKSTFSFFLSKVGELASNTTNDF